MLLAALVDGRALWYLTRGTGLAALGLLTISVVLGISQVVRYAPRGWPRFVLLALHRNASLLAVAFLAVHIATSVADGYAPIRWLDAILPFQSPYRPLWLGLGAIACDLLLALIITSLLRERLGYRMWRAVHWAAYACWPVAFAHGLGTGTDVRVGWVQVIDAACLLAVVAAVGWRLGGRPAPLAAPRPASLRLAAGGASLAVVAGLVLFTAWGPLQPGWARRAGTPAALLGGNGIAATGTIGTDVGSTGLHPPFTVDLTGTVTEAQTDQGDAAVTIDATLSGGAAGTVQLILVGRPLAGGGVALQSSNATMGSSAQPDQYRGSVIGLDGGSVRLALRDAGGTAVDVVLDLTLDAGTVTGQAVASAATGAGG